VNIADKIIEDIKNLKQLKYDYQVAKLFKIKKGSISNWRKNKKVPKYVAVYYSELLESKGMAYDSTNQPAQINEQLNIEDNMEHESEYKERRYQHYMKEGRERIFDRDTGIIWEEVPGTDEYIKVGQIPAD